MNTLNLNTALIAIQVLSIDEQNNTAQINFAYSEPNKNGEAKKWHQIDMDEIYITGRAIYKLNDPENKDVLIGKVYSSVNKSKDAKENPFCLMRKHAVDSKGESYPVYYLKCVEENGSYVKKITLPDGNEASERIFRPNKSEYNYVRYCDVYEKQKFYHDKHIAENQTA